MDCATLIALDRALADTLHRACPDWRPERDLRRLLGPTLFVSAVPGVHVALAEMDGRPRVAISRDGLDSPLGGVLLCYGAALLDMAPGGGCGCPHAAWYGAARRAVPSAVLADLRAGALRPAEVAPRLGIPAELVWFRMAMSDAASPGCRAALRSWRESWHRMLLCWSNGGATCAELARRSAARHLRRN